MPRRVDSDEEESIPKRKKASTRNIPRTTSKKAAIIPKKKIPVSKLHDPVIAAWTKRRTVENLDGIEDVETGFPKKEGRKLLFEVDDGKKSLA